MWLLLVLAGTLCAYIEGEATHLLCCCDLLVLKVGHSCTQRSEEARAVTA